MSNLIGVFRDDTDGCTYSSEHCLGIFDDLDKAKALAEKTIREDNKSVLDLHDRTTEFVWEDMDLYSVTTMNKSRDVYKDDYHYIKLEFIELNEER